MKNASMAIVLLTSRMHSKCLELLLLESTFHISFLLTFLFIPSLPFVFSIFNSLSYCTHPDQHKINTTLSHRLLISYHHSFSLMFDVRFRTPYLRLFLSCTL